MLLKPEEFQLGVSIGDQSVFPTVNLLQIH